MNRLKYGFKLVLSVERDNYNIIKYVIYIPMGINSILEIHLHNYGNLNMHVNYKKFKVNSII